MKKLNFSLVSVLAAFVSMTSFDVNAATVIADYTFEDNAFVDQVVSSNGLFLNYTSATTSDVISSAQLEADLTDHDAGTYVLSFSPNAYVDLAFGSTNVFNGDGNDLAIFFVGDATFSVDLMGQTHSYTTSNTDFIVTDMFDTYTLNVAFVDLADFGFAQGDSLGTFRIMLDNNAPALSLVGAFNSGEYVAAVPLPAPFVLLVSGLVGLGVIGRRKN